MKKKCKVLSLLLALCLVFSSLAVLAEENTLHVVHDLGNFRIVSANARQVPSPGAGGPVWMYENMGVTDKEGNIIVPAIYREIRVPVEGRSLFYIDGHAGFFDENWNIVIPPIYRGAADFSEGLAVVSDENWIRGFINKNGELIVPHLYSNASNFQNGTAHVAFSETGYYGQTFLRTGLIDTAGNILSPLIYRHEPEYDILKSQNMIQIGENTYDNRELLYPFINYLGLAYFPLTYDTCRALGIITAWTPETGLVLTTGEEPHSSLQGPSSMPNNEYDKAMLYSGTLTINGTAYKNTEVYYPLLFYKDIIYFPVLWRQGMEALGIEYQYILPPGMEGKMMGTMRFTRK